MSRRDEDRLADLEDALARLRSAADGALVVVEGQNDAAALAALGVGGEVRPVHTGAALQAWMDALCEEADRHGWREVILLVDWDRTGGRLFRRLLEGLRARLPVDGDHRRRIARASHAKSLEDVPADLAGLRRRVPG